MYKQSEQQKNFEQAVIQTQIAGVVTLINVESCCRSCASAEMAGQGIKEDTDVVWTFAGQGNRIEWHDGQPMRMEEEEVWHEPTYVIEIDDEGNEVEVEEDVEEDIEYRPVPAEDVYLYHSGGLNAPRIAAEKFREAGFEVEWDGTEHTAVLVKFK